MIVIVAAYTPPGSAGSAHLGASRKLEMIISILSRLNFKIVLVNTAHNDNRIAPICVNNSVINNVELTEITPTISNSSKFGKLKNLFDVTNIIRLIEKIGKPEIFWLYNGYAFEMLFALKAHKVFVAPIIFEFEDWHFSRRRGINPKPYIDYVFWRIAAKHLPVTFAVNSFLAGKMHRFSSEITLLPGIVPKVLTKISIETKPFCFNSNKISIGFFGGLVSEKGADIVLELIALMPSSFVFHVTGSGPLEENFTACAKLHPDKLFFHGRVDEGELYKLIEKCDVILNPHASIKNMKNGVFPFKVIEAIASGRLLISTDLPLDGLEDVLRGVQFVEHSANAFCNALHFCRQTYLINSSYISQGADIASQKFGEAALFDKVRSIINKQG
jgi:glycosyltransferase involved in cell wall biosynthesis